MKPLVLCLCLSLLASFAMADGPAQLRPSDVAPVPSPSHEDQEKMVGLLADFEPRFPQFGAACPNNIVEIFIQERAPGRTVLVLATTNVANEYYVSLSFKVRFDEKLTKVEESRFDGFGALSLHETADHGGRVKSAELALEDMDDFCADPLGFVKKKVTAQEKEKSARPH